VYIFIYASINVKPPLPMYGEDWGLAMWGFM